MWVCLACQVPREEVSLLKAPNDYHDFPSADSFDTARFIANCSGGNSDITKYHHDVGATAPAVVMTNVAPRDRLKIYAIKRLHLMSSWL
jgi:hypothetical protein